MLEFSYKHEWDYLDKRNIVVLCKRCHFAIHHGKILCPKCKKAYMRYENRCCYSCLPQDEKDRIEAAIEARKQKVKDLKELRRKREKDARERYKKLNKGRSAGTK
jgi:formate-dependent nitrite reductase cytochrome c552 subunit